MIFMIVPLEWYFLPTACCLCTGPGSLIILAPPCSSWTRVSRGTTMRSRLNPTGLDYTFVAEANLTISRLLA